MIIIPDKLRIKWQSFKAIELEITKLFRFLERHRAHHLFRSSHLKAGQPKIVLKSSFFVFFGIEKLNYMG